MENGIVRVKIENGYYLFKLNQLLSEKEISKNKLLKEINTDFKVIQRLATGNVTRIDISVLARICDYLQCSITDIIEYEST